MIRDSEPVQVGIFFTLWLVFDLALMMVPGMTEELACVLACGGAYVTMYTWYRYKEIGRS